MTLKELLDELDGDGIVITDTEAIDAALGTFGIDGDAEL